MKNTNFKRNFLVIAALLCSAIMVYAAEDVSVSESSSGENIVTEKIKANKSTLEKSQEAINSKDFATAVKYLSGYINSKPQKYEAYKLRGDAYYELRQYKLAKDDYQTAVNIKSSADKAMTSTKYISAVILGADKNEQLQNAELGELYGRLMYAQKALNDPAYATSYENAIKYNSHIYLPKPKKNDIYQINTPQKYGKPLNPQGIDVYIYGAVDEIAKDNFNEALYKLQNVTSDYPNYYLGYYLTGVALSGLEKYDDAQKAFEKSISLNPYDFESYASLGQIYYDKAETTFSSSEAKKSIEYFNKALELNPNCHLYYFYIALNNMQIGNIDLAISNFDKALSLNSNDYNSMYYKAIAEFNAGDYDSVVNLTTMLLYKHVSNTNSVLYLRALAYYKQGDEEKALTDLDTVLNNINDIYNADVKVVSDKEKTLNSYIHYLKSEMAHQYGYGAASDVDQAMQNPIIAQLTKVEKAMQPYEKALRGDSISLKDYHKYEAFYNTGLPKLLNSGIVITDRDIDNQYDYIRTTFGDLGISFVYKNPDYKMSIIENYPYKKYSQKLNKNDVNTLASSVPEDVVKSTVKSKTPELKTKTSAQEMIGDNSKVSLAQMIAANELPKTLQKTEMDSDNNSKHDAESENSSNIADGEPFIFKDKKYALLNDKNSEQVNSILKEEKEIDNTDKKLQKTQNTEKSSEPTKLVAQEFKPSDDITIKYGKSDDKNSKAEEKISANDFMREEKGSNKSTSRTNKIIEKHANVNPEDYGVKPRKTIEISEKDEVIVLEQPTLEKSIEKINKQEDVKPENNVHVFNQPKSVAKEQMKERAIQLSQENQQLSNPEKEVPVVVVPEIRTSEKAPLIRSKEDNSESADKGLISADSNSDNINNIHQKAENSVKEISATQSNIVQKINESEEEVSNSVVSNVQETKQVINQEQQKLERAQAKMLLKAQKEQEKLEAKLNKQKLKEERAAAKAQARAIAQKAKEEAKAKAAQLKAEQELAKAQAKAENERLKALAKMEKEKARQEAKEKAKQLKEEKDAVKAQINEMKEKVEQETKTEVDKINNSEKIVPAKKTVIKSLGDK